MNRLVKGTFDFVIRHCDRALVGLAHNVQRNAKVPKRDWSCNVRLCLPYATKLPRLSPYLRQAAPRLNNSLTKCPFSFKLPYPFSP